MKMDPTNGRARFSLAVLTLAIALVATACGGTAAGPSASPSLDPATDKLGQVLVRGTLVLSTDFDYAPQSSKVAGATRLAGTKCAANQATAPEVTGYDADTGKLVAEALSVEPCFVAPQFSEIIAGSWADHWDLSFGSGALTADRMTRLYVTQPYYSTPANFFVLAKSSYTKPADLSGKQIGSCAGCTHESYLKKTLTLPGETLDFPVVDPKIVTFASEPPGLDAVAAGKIDAFLCSQPVGAAAIAAGAPLRMLDQAAFFTQKTGYIDRGLALAPGPFLDRVNAAIRDLHASGKLKALSIKYFGVDYATAAGAFDLASVGQKVP
jgi:polar amino acid transport system substrate-binding protein